MKIFTTSAKESFTEADAYATLVSADQRLDEAVMFYKQMKENFPQWEDVLDTLIQQTLYQKGEISALRTSLSDVEAITIQKGEDSALSVLDDSVSEPISDNPLSVNSKEDDIIALIDYDPATESVDDEDDEDYIILAKESDDPEEAFLEYHYPQRLMAQGAFFDSKYPTALLIKRDGQWVIEAMSVECDDWREILDEQVSLLNA